MANRIYASVCEHGLNRELVDCKQCENKTRRNHPQRSGAISAELFAEIMSDIRTSASFEAPDGHSLGYVKQRIMDAALAIAVRRAARKFRWTPNFNPVLEVDLAGYVHGGNELSAEIIEWLKYEIWKISRKAMAVLS